MFFSDGVETGPDFVPGLPHAVAHSRRASFLRWRGAVEDVQQRREALLAAQSRVVRSMRRPEERAWRAWRQAVRRHRTPRVRTDAPPAAIAPAAAASIRATVAELVSDTEAATRGQDTSATRGGQRHEDSDTRTHPATPSSTTAFAFEVSAACGGRTVTRALARARARRRLRRTFAALQHAVVYS